MSTDETQWDKLAADLADRVRRNLSGSSAEESLPTRGSVKIRGAVRTRGSAATADSAARTLERAITVVVMSPRVTMPIEQIQRRLATAGIDAKNLDIYYVVHDRSESDLAMRELNPEDPECGRKHQLILTNLKPDIVILPSDQQRPSWCGHATQLIVA